MPPPPSPSAASLAAPPPLDTDVLSAAEVLATIHHQRYRSLKPAVLATKHHAFAEGVQAAGQSLPRTLLPRLKGSNTAASETSRPWAGSGTEMKPGSIAVQSVGTKRKFEELGSGKVDNHGAGRIAESADVTPWVDPTATPATPTTFKPAFQFVVNEDVKQARKTVRKHVMREYRRKERWEHGDNKTGKATGGGAKGRRKAPRTIAQCETPSSESPSVEAASPWSAETEGKSDGNMEMVLDQSRRLGTPEDDEIGTIGVIEKAEETETDNENSNNFNDCGPPYHADPWAAVARSQVDPFSNINFDVGSGTQALLHHFAWVMPSIMDEMVVGTNFHRIGWLYSCVAVHDPTPIHVILGFTLAHIAQLHGTKEPPLAIEHKQQALKLIKERMEDPVEVVSNSSVGAVVNIAGYELVDGNAQGFATHMTGLSRMINERGGMATLRDNPDLEDEILRLDVVRAYIAISSPRYPDYLIVRSLDPIAINVPPKFPGWSSANLLAGGRREVYFFCEDCIYLIHELEDFMLLIGSAAREMIEWSESTNISNKRSGNLIQHMLMSAATQLLCRQELGNPLASRLSRKCCRLATLIFIDLAIKELFDSPQTSGHFVHYLKSRLLGTMTPWGRSIEMLVMVLIKHDRMALERAWRAWYIADVVTMHMNLAEESWSIAEQKMLEYVLQDTLEVAPGLRSTLVWDMQTMVEVFINEWG